MIYLVNYPMGSDGKFLHTRIIFQLGPKLATRYILSLHNLKKNLLLENLGEKIMNTMVMIEINNGTFDDWKKGFDNLADMRAQFSRNAKVGKVDDHTAIGCR